jgi:hypothetical protein
LDAAAFAVLDDPRVALDILESDTLFWIEDQ